MKMTTFLFCIGPDKIPLNVLEAIYIAITPTMQTVKQSYFKYFWGSVGDRGDLNIFFSPCLFNPII